jgi:hypothetical protein
MSQRTTDCAGSVRRALEISGAKGSVLLEEYGGF